MALNSEATKWSRNLSEESQTDSNRMRLIERQRQLLESKRQRQQQITPTARQQITRSAKSISSFDKFSEKLIVEDNSKDVFDGIFNPSLSTTEDSMRESRDVSLSSPVLLAESRKQIEVEDMSPIKSANESKQSSNATRTPKADEVDVETPNVANEQLKSDNAIHKAIDIKELNPLTTILNNNELLLFITQPIPPSKTYQCVIVRDKRGIDRSFYPTYYMHLQAIVSNEMPNNGSDKPLVPSSPTIKGEESNSRFSFKNTNFPGRVSGNQPNRRQIFLLGGRRRKRSKTYLIGNDPFDITRDNCIAKLKSNVLGTQFNAIKMNSDGHRYEVVSVIYETNVLGFKGPRKMTALLPKNPEVCRSSENTLYDVWKCNNKSIYQLKNKTPVWNEDTQSYVLNFHGRVTQASVKNFQLVLSGKQKDEVSSPSSSHSIDSSTPLESPTLSLPVSSSSPSFAPTIPAPSTSSGPSTLDEDIVMQFGRVSEKEFTCDVTWPMSLMQAFAVALSSFDSKLACE